MRKPQISLCMIVKNEEDVIARCLQSAKNAVDEIIVVDSGSTDRTADIALSEGAAVHHRPWRHDFAAARNESIALAAGDWILVLDADETLEEGHGALLREMIERSPEADGFFVRIVNYVGTESQHTGSTVSSSLRFFRNLPGYRYAGRIHEQIVQPILTANPQAKLEYTSIQLNHGGYLPETVLKKNKVRRNLELLQKELEHTDNESFHRYNLGVEHLRLGEYEKALEQFVMSRTIADWRRTSFGHVVVLREANCLQALSRWKEAVAVCQAASGDLNDYPDLFFTLGRIHYHLRQWDQAEAAFRKALDIGEAPPQYTSSSGTGTYGACFHLGKVREQLQDYEGAIEWYARALKFHSGLLSPFLRLIGLIARLYDAGKITETMERLFQLESAKTWWSIALSYYQLGLYEQAVYVLKQRPLPENKLRDSRLLLLRCNLLQTREGSAFLSESGMEAGSMTARAGFYDALIRNDDREALRCLEKLEAKQAGKLSDPSESGPDSAIDPVNTLILDLYTYVVRQRMPRELPQNLPAKDYAVLWSELIFLYMLASKRHLFTLKSLVSAYWRHLLLTLTDPLQRLKGRYEMIKCLHVKIFHIFQETDDGSLEYAPLWDHVKPRLMTLIDDLLMEENY